VSDEDEWLSASTKEENNRGSFMFKTEGCKEPVIVIKNNGDFYIKGNLVTNDMEIYEAFKEWVKAQKW
jgi:hypothetical protein